MPKITGSIGKGGQNDEVDTKVVQHLLNRFRPQGAALLRVDGLVGHLTIGAIEDLQIRVMGLAHADGLVFPGGSTFKTLCGGDPSKDTLAWGAKVTSAFVAKVVVICRELDIPADFLMAAMAFETGETFSPSIQNAAGSGAVGLIQFMPSTAKDLGTTTAKLAQMTAVEQLDFVSKYFKPRKGKLKSLEDVYMAILLPAAIGKPSNRVLFKKGTTAYAQNKGLDVDKNGNVTIAEASSKVRTKYDRGIRPTFLG